MKIVTFFVLVVSKLESSTASSSDVESSAAHNKTKDILKKDLGLVSSSKSRHHFASDDDMSSAGYWYSAEGSQSYFEARGKCKWSSPISAPEFWGKSFLYTKSQAFNQFWHDAGKDNLLVRECHTPDVDREGQLWIIRRFGPFNTTGGAKEGEWHTTKFLEPVHKRWVTGNFGGRINEEGELFTSPPLHVHHEHVSYTECLPSYLRASRQVLETMRVNRITAIHGDNYFVNSEGGAIGNAYKSFPEGVGKRMENVYYFDNRIGDIRPPGSPVMQWWNEIGYRYTLETPKRELLHMSRFNLANFFENVKIHIPEDTGSIFWMSWKMPTNGEMETNWCHTHGAEHIIIFKGDPSKFALGGKYAKKDPWTPKHVDDVDTVADELIQSAREAGIGHCNGNIQWDGEEPRMTQFNCKPWHFKKGDVVAIVSLYDTARRPNTNTRQHLIFRGDYYPDDPNLIEKDTGLIFENLQFCGENPDHCVSQASLGYKMYMVFFNRGWMPEYYAYKSVFGWIIAIGIFGLALFGTYKLCMWLRNMFLLKILSNSNKDKNSSEYKVLATKEN